MKELSMGENNAKEHRSSTHAKRQKRSEEARNLLEEPDQRRRDGACLLRNEKIRLISLGLGLLLLLASFVLFLLGGTVLLLSVTIVVVFLGYRRLDAWLDATEQQ
jgi:Flp pilus assembly protein TadB